MTSPIAHLCAAHLCAWLQRARPSWDLTPLAHPFGLRALPHTPKEPTPSSALELLELLESHLDARRVQVFTPPPVARWLAARLPATHPILDPATGTGRLLIAALNARVECGESPEQALSAGLRGVELDPDALAVARAGLLARACELGLGRLVVPRLICQDALAAPLEIGGHVIMNPPYANADQLSEDAHQRAAARWPFHRRQLDQSVCFIAAAVEALALPTDAAPGGTLAAVVPRYWLEATRAAGFRRWLTRHARIDALLDLGNVQLWPGVNVLTALLVATRTHPCEEAPPRWSASFWRAPGAAEVHGLLSGEPPSDRYDVPGAALTEAPWVMRPPAREAALEALAASGTPCRRWFASGQGIKTGLNRVFVLSRGEAARRDLPAALLAPLLKGRDVHPCRIQETDRALLQLAGAMELERWPAVARYLAPHREALEARYQFRHGACPWYGLAIPQNLAWMERAPKIVTPLYPRRNRFALDRRGRSALTDLYMLVPTGPLPAPIEAVVCLLNSAPLRAFAAARAKLKRDGYREYGARLLGALPLPFTDDGRAVDGPRTRRALARLGITADGAWGALREAHARLEAGEEEEEAVMLEVDRLAWALFGFAEPPWEEP